jgi:hypothetical protein
MQRLGQEGLKAVAMGKVAEFSRLYWFTVEFGMALEDGALKLYGAGLASSFGEAAYALDSPKPERLPFDLERAIRMPYRSDTIQPALFRDRRPGNAAHRDRSGAAGGNPRRSVTLSRAKRERKGEALDGDPP